MAATRPQASSQRSRHPSTVRALAPSLDSRSRRGWVLWSGGRSHHGPFLDHARPADDVRHVEADRRVAFGGPRRPFRQVKNCLPARFRTPGAPNSYGRGVSVEYDRMRLVRRAVQRDGVVTHYHVRCCCCCWRRRLRGRVVQIPANGAAIRAVHGVTVVHLLQIRELVGTSDNQAGADRMYVGRKAQQDLVDGNVFPAGPGPLAALWTGRATVHFLDGEIGTRSGGRTMRLAEPR